jgi:hypothetical protein
MAKRSAARPGIPGKGNMQAGFRKAAGKKNLYRRQERI